MEIEMGDIAANLLTLEQLSTLPYIVASCHVISSVCRAIKIGLTPPSKDGKSCREQLRDIYEIRDGSFSKYLRTHFVDV